MAAPKPEERIRVRIVRTEPLEVLVEGKEKQTWTHAIGQLGDGRLVEADIKKADPTEDEIIRALLEKVPAKPSWFGKTFEIIPKGG